MRAREIRHMADEQILDAIEDQKEALFNLRFQLALGQLENPQSIKLTRRTIARLKTILRERQHAAQHVKQEGKGNA